MPPSTAATSGTRTPTPDAPAENHDVSTLRKAAPSSMFANDCLGRNAGGGLGGANVPNRPDPHPPSAAQSQVLQGAAAGRRARRTLPAERGRFGPEVPDVFLAHFDEFVTIASRYRDGD